MRNVSVYSLQLRWRRLAGTGPVRRGLVLLAMLSPLAAGTLSIESAAQSAGAESITSRHIGASRTRATQTPRSEGDQAIVDGWPLYRTERGQTAFNDTMATLKATDGQAPAAEAFKGCANLECNLTLPAITQSGWIPAGRIWVSPSEYVLFAHSPRGRANGRHAQRSMRYFVYHEFHNSSRNVDPYDTISSHSGSVYVPLYMSKQATDARGRQFVVVLQIAPYDVISIHDSSRGSAGPGMEVAKNVTDTLEPLQAKAGVLVGVIIKAAAPQIRVVNHGGNEGLPMLNAYEQRLSALRARANAPAVSLPFVPATAPRIAAASASIDDLILRRGASPRIPVAKRGIVQSASLGGSSTADAPAFAEPTLVEPIREVTRSVARAAANGEPVLVGPIRRVTRRTTAEPVVSSGN